MGIFDGNDELPVFSERARLFLTYLTHSLEGQSEIKPVADLDDTGRRDNVVDTLVRLERQIEQCQHCLVVGHIGSLEENPRRHLLLWRKVFSALP